METVDKWTHAIGGNSDIVMQDSPLSKRAVLVRLHISAYGGEKKDKRMTEHAEDAYGIERNSRKTKVTKKLLAEAVKSYLKPVSFTRREHEFLTLPYSDTNLRILPTELYMEYNNRMNTCKDAIDTAIDAVIYEWESHMNKDRRIFNSAFNIYDYPTRQEFREEYSFSTFVQPIPDAGNWIVDIEREEMQKLRAKLHDSISNEFSAAIADTWDRLHKVVLKMKTDLTEFGAPISGTNRTRTFRDTLVTNVSDLCAILPALNISGNADMAALAERAQKALTEHTAEDLRKDPKLRQNLVREADAMLSAMSGYIGS